MAATFHDDQSIGVNQSIAQFRIDSKAFASSIIDLEKALRDLNSSKPETVEKAKKLLILSRLNYKKIEYILEYFFYTSSRVYNRAPKNEVEEPFLEYQELAGLQYLETLLFDSIPEQHKVIFEEQTTLLRVASEDLNALLYNFSATDPQLLESFRISLVRIISLGITGFDAPLLKSGIQESAVVVQTMHKSLLPYIVKNKSAGDSVDFFLRKTYAYLKDNPDFEDFNRLEFLTNCALPLQKHLGRLIRGTGSETNKYGILNYGADHIFSQNAFQTNSFPGSNRAVSKSEIALGEKLFSETALSGNGTKSCVSCHNPENYFSDGLVKSVGFDPTATAKRHAPTLIYAGMQHNQFWDGRAKSLEEQIEAVIKDPLEMRGDMAASLARLNADKNYRKHFQKAFSKKGKSPISEEEVYRALASYIRTLNPNNSPFDQYMAGNEMALTEIQKEGFNLFMGKAQCGTCHFAPLFNGLTPPFYSLSEFEILGTTRTEDLKNPEPDEDDGRFTFRPIRFYKGAFKTPTVRNSAKTGPYMHNGAFQSLETLLEFYNLGGGAGLGLNFPSQTLSAGKLNLTETEKKNIIEFLNSLTDDLKAM
ncbi:cytochrome C peroxidase [Dyadobacter sp. CY345]|uniref:cytochrome-c peroxidase n=1 Tax=Dyadobacter sp. CY345 TaxID=2909335 RepID=UPI001F162794|nr:cytochrome c peroxidase [Dyadobacter sp. CY345]MCF2447230.1 cytochrome C peroxidase [Dyadobacter sp. CY345]